MGKQICIMFVLFSHSFENKCPLPPKTLTVPAYQTNTHMLVLRPYCAPTRGVYKSWKCSNFRYVSAMFQRLKPYHPAPPHTHWTHGIQSETTVVDRRLTSATPKASNATVTYVHDTKAQARTNTVFRRVAHAETQKWRHERRECPWTSSWKHGLCVCRDPNLQR